MYVEWWHDTAGRQMYWLYRFFSGSTFEVHVYLNIVKRESSLKRWIYIRVVDDGWWLVVAYASVGSARPYKKCFMEVECGDNVIEHDWEEHACMLRQKWMTWSGCVVERQSCWTSSMLPPYNLAIRRDIKCVKVAASLMTFFFSFVTS